MLLAVLNSEAREALCRRCGASCHFPMAVGSKNYILPEIHCRFLERRDDGRHNCRVYENRFEMAPWCHKAEDAAAVGALADDCPYARDIPGYEGKHWATGSLREALVARVCEKLIKEGLALSVDPVGAVGLLGADWTYREESGRFVFYRKNLEELEQP